MNTEVLHNAELNRYEINLDGDPSARVQTGVGGADLEVNIDRDGIRVQPTQRPSEPAPPR